MLEADYYGPDNVFDVNGDIEKGSMTLNDCQISYKAEQKMLAKSPNTKHFCFIVASAYGMI